MGFKNRYKAVIEQLEGYTLLPFEAAMYVMWLVVEDGDAEFGLNGLTIYTDEGMEEYDEGVLDGVMKITPVAIYGFTVLAYLDIIAPRIIESYPIITAISIGAICIPFFLSQRVYSDRSVDFKTGGESV